MNHIKIKNVYILILLAGALPLWAQTAFVLKSAPADLNVYLNDVLIRPVSSESGHRTYRIAGTGVLRFSAEGYIPIYYNSDDLPVRNGITGIKLENETPVAVFRGEYATGSQPKSAYFSPDGRRLFIPLLGQHGIDVFRHINGSLEYETRLTVPESRAIGFVEALCDDRRRELWVSNMLENKVHIFDLDTLEYKTSLNTGGVYPKVIAQSPDGKYTVVSNWVSMTISVFDSDTKELLRRIPVSGTPRGMAFSPDSSALYVAIYDAALIDVIDMAQNSVTQSFRFHTRTGAARHIIYWDDKLYVSDMYQGTVNIIDPSTGELLRSRFVGLNINTITLSPDGRYVFASSRGQNHPDDYTIPGPDFGAVYMLDARDLSLIERIWGRNQPTGLAVSPNGSMLVFTDFLDANLELYHLQPFRRNVSSIPY